MDSEGLRDYLRAIREIPRITPEEERELGRLIQAGRVAAKRLAELEAARENGLMPIDYQSRIRELRRTIQAGEQAKRQLVERHLRLAASRTFRYKNRGVAMMDLIQDANMALMRAAENCDYTGVPDNRFATFAAAYVDGALKESCNRVSVIHFSAFMLHAIRNVRKVSGIIWAVTGQNPTPKMVAEEMNAPLDLIYDLFDLWWTAWKITSLDAPISEEGEDPLLCLVVDEEDDGDPATVVTASSVRETVAAVLATLEHSEEKVIRFRFGFVDGSPHSQEEVSQACGMSLQEERLTEVRALRQLRHPSRSNQLVGLLG